MLTVKAQHKIFKTFAVLVYVQICLHHMVILGSQNKIPDFSVILAWLCRFNLHFGKHAWEIQLQKFKV